MIVKYNDGYYCYNAKHTPVRIWTYVPVEDAEKNISSGGTVYYEKKVEMEELEKIFDIGFTVKWKDELCGAEPSADGENVNLSLGHQDEKFATEHGFEPTEYDRGIVVLWRLEADINSCQEFYVKIWQSYPEDKEEVLTLSKEEWLKLYKKVKTETTVGGKDKIRY